MKNGPLGTLVIKKNRRRELIAAKISFLTTRLHAMLFYGCEVLITSLRNEGRVTVLADVQLENGYTRIANDILENIIRLPLNGTQFKIIILLWRETYGFSRKECKFSDSYIASKLGIKRQNVNSELKSLENAGLIKIIKPPTHTSPRIVAFGKDFESWRGTHAIALQACRSMTRTDKHYRQACRSMTGV